MLDTLRRQFSSARRLSLIGLLVIVAIFAGVLLARRTLDGPQRRFREALRAVEAKDVKRIRQIAVALDEFPEYSPHAHLLWGILALDGGRPQEALSELGQASDHVETRVLALTFMGEVYYHLNRYVEAERVLLAAIADDPTQADARRWLAAVYYDLGAFDMAVNNLLVISRMAPQDFRPYRLLGLIEKDFEKYPQAINSYREALRRGMSDEVREEIAVEMAECQIELKRFQDALHTLEMARENSQTMTLRARCLTNLGKHDDAIQDLTQALAADPNYMAAATVKARILLELGKAADGLAVLEPFAEAGSKDYEFQFLLAQTHERLGNREQADRAHQAVQQLRTLREQFSKLHIQANDDPYSAEVRFQLGITAIELGKPKLGVTWLKATLTLDPTHAKAAERLRELTNKSINKSISPDNNPADHKLK